MKRVARRRSVRKPKRRAAGGATSGRGSVPVMVGESTATVGWRMPGTGRSGPLPPVRGGARSQTSEPAAALEVGLLALGDVVQCCERILCPGQDRVDVTRLDLEHLRVLRNIPEVAQVRDGLRVVLIPRPRVEDVL